MRKFLTLASATALTLTSACASMPKGEPAAAPGTVGGAYIVVGADFELPARDGMPAVAGVPMNLDDYMDIADLDSQCWAKIRPYMPSAEKEIAAMAGRTALGNGIGNFIGSGLGAIAAFTGVGFLDYAKLGGIQGFFGGAGAGASAAVTQHKIAVNFAQYACMTYAITWAHRHGRAQGVEGVIPWAGPTNPKPMKPPSDTRRHLSSDERFCRDNPDDETCDRSEEYPSEPQVMPLPGG